MTDNDKEIIRVMNEAENVDDLRINFINYEKHSQVGISIKEILDFINRQQAEIERLNEDKSFLKDEFERFRIRVLPIAKSEAIKEFAEKLKDKEFEIPVDANNVGYLLGADDIDNLVKEMVGEDK